MSGMLLRRLSSPSRSVFAPSSPCFRPNKPRPRADTRFDAQEVDVGMAADIGSLARVPKIIGNESFTREVAFTARNFSAAEALSAGFLSAVVKGEKKTAKQDVLGSSLCLGVNVCGEEGRG